jgi:hypothetical protein
MNVNEVRPTPQPMSPAKPIRKGSAKQFQSEMDAALPVQAKQEQAKVQPAALTNSEKNYFEQLFPNSREEVRAYNPYQKENGKVEIRLGTLLDRKG